MPTSLLPRPGRYAFHAEGIVTDLPTVAEQSGYVPATIANPDTANALGKSGGRWDQYGDVSCAQVGDYLDTSASWFIRGQYLTYPTASGLGPLSPLTTPAVMAADCRTDFDDTVLSIAAASPYTFQATRRTWFYGSLPPGPGLYAAVRIEVVALATAATPGPAEVALGGVDTDATDVTANVPGSAIGDQWVSDVPWKYTASMILADVNAEAITIAGGTGTLLDVTGDGTNAAIAVDGAGTTALDATTTGADTSAFVRQLGAGKGLEVLATSGGGASVENISTLPTFTARNTGGGKALEANNSDATNAAATITNTGGGPSLATLAGTLKVDGGLEVNSAASILGVAGGSLSGDGSATMIWNGPATFGGRMNVGTGTSTLAGDFSKDANDNLEYNDGATKKVHVSPTGYFKGYGQSNVEFAAAVLTLDTSAAVAPIVAADIDVHATFWIQRILAGDIIVSLEEIGVGQISTSGSITLPAKSGNNFLPVNFCRTHSASITPRVYRLRVDGNGSNVNATNLRVVALPGAST